MPVYTVACGIIAFATVCTSCVCVYCLCPRVPCPVSPVPAPILYRVLCNIILDSHIRITLLFKWVPTVVKLNDMWQIDWRKLEKMIYDLPRRYYRFGATFRDISLYISAMLVVEEEHSCPAQSGESGNSRGGRRKTRGVWGMPRLHGHRMLALAVFPGSTSTAPNAAGASSAEELLAEPPHARAREVNRRMGLP